jgi:hypothetical protein
LDLQWDLEQRELSQQERELADQGIFGNDTSYERHRVERERELAEQIRQQEVQACEQEQARQRNLVEQQIRDAQTVLENEQSRLQQQAELQAQQTAFLQLKFQETERLREQLQFEAQQQAEIRQLHFIQAQENLQQQYVESNARAQQELQDKMTWEQARIREAEVHLTQAFTASAQQAEGLLQQKSMLDQERLQFELQQKREIAALESIRQAHAASSSQSGMIGTYQQLHTPKAFHPSGSGGPPGLSASLCPVPPKASISFVKPDPTARIPPKSPAPEIHIPNLPLPGAGQNSPLHFNVGTDRTGRQSGKEWYDEDEDRKGRKERKEKQEYDRKLARMQKEFEEKVRRRNERGRTRDDFDPDQSPTSSSSGTSSDSNSSGRRRRRKKKKKKDRNEKKDRKDRKDRSTPRQLVTNYKEKELVLPAQPNARQLADWRFQVRGRVKVCANRPHEKALVWFLRVQDLSVTMDELQIPGAEHYILDGIIAGAMIKIATGQLKTDIVAADTLLCQRFVAVRTLHGSHA